MIFVKIEYGKAHPFLSRLKVWTLIDVNIDLLSFYLQTSL